MAKGTVAWKIIRDHLVHGEMEPGKEIAIRIDQTLTQDATGTMAYLEFEAMGVDEVKTPDLSVSYIDHNTLQLDFRNPDDHEYLRTVGMKYGLWVSKPGNGICHQVHLERFTKPGKTLLGSDSHTPTAGGAGMLAIGAGGLDVAAAMAGEPFYTKMPKIVKVELKGKRLPDWVSAKDVILKLLQMLTVKGGLMRIFEYTGEGVKALTVPERATITNMGAELGATTSIFPSDEVTLDFFRRQGREQDWVELVPDADAEYDEEVVIDLEQLEPLIAQPHSPDNVVPVRELHGKVKVNQVVIGSCTNSSYRDLKTVAEILKGKKVHRDVSLIIAPGSRQVLEQIARDGTLADLINAGARIIETACGPCIGMGWAPPSKGVSVRSFNRNFKGRSGTLDAGVYLASPEVCAAAALTGYITDPRTLGEPVKVTLPEKFLPYNDALLLPPLPKEERENVEIRRGPNIRPLPEFDELPEAIKGKVEIKVGDNITTDHIMPAGAKILPLRSNIYEISKYVYHYVDEGFAERALKNKEQGLATVIVGGENYGQGSSREHAALAPRYLGVRAVIAKSFARIHHQNLCNFGILPLEFVNPADYDRIDQNDEIEIPDARGQLTACVKEGKPIKVIVKKPTGETFEIETTVNITPRQYELLMAGGLLNYIKNKQSQNKEA